MNLGKVIIRRISVWLLHYKKNFCGKGYSSQTPQTTDRGRGDTLMKGVPTRPLRWTAQKRKVTASASTLSRRSATRGSFRFPCNVQRTRETNRSSYYDSCVGNIYRPIYNAKKSIFSLRHFFFGDKRRGTWDENPSREPSDPYLSGIVCTTTPDMRSSSLRRHTVTVGYTSPPTPEHFWTEENCAGSSRNSLNGID